MLLVLSIFLSGSAKALADAASVATQTLEIIDAKPLKKAGADELNVRIDVQENSPMKAWLQGTKKGGVIWERPIPLREEFNPAKMDAICRNGKLVIMSQYPGSAAYNSETFSWDGNILRFISSKAGDPSLDVVTALINLAKAGSRMQMDQWEEQDHNVMYPSNYITVEALEKLLGGGQKTALVLAKAGKPALAAQRMEICFDASANMIALLGGDSNKAQTPDKWIELWQTDCLELPVREWAPKLTNYAIYLQECGKYKQAVNVLRASLKALPSQADAYLHLADSLWATNQHQEASHMYQKFAQLVGQSNKAKDLPTRVKSRASS